MKISKQHIEYIADKLSTSINSLNLKVELSDAQIERLGEIIGNNLSKPKYTYKVQKYCGSKIYNISSPEVIQVGDYINLHDIHSYWKVSKRIFDGDEIILIIEQ